MATRASNSSGHLSTTGKGKEVLQAHKMVRVDSGFEQSHTASLVTSTLSRSDEDMRLLDEGPAPDVVIPPSIIHWTSPSTRRREYAEIENHYRGFRGLCRRFAPRWCFKWAVPCQQFYDGKEADASSVRRYRLELPEDDGGEAGDSLTAEQEENAQQKSARPTWSCWRRKGRKRPW